MSEHTNPSGRYPHVVKAFLETPWAIEPVVLMAIQEVIALRSAGERFTEEEIAARIGAGPSPRKGERRGSVAILPIHGVLFPRANLFTQISGGSSVQELQKSLREAVADDDVESIVLDVNSPGGMVDMIPEFAAEIREARSQKRVVAVSNTKAASAALWLATQAGEFVASPSAQQGSIGVFAAHEDWSRAEEMEGVKTTLVSAGRFKVSGHPYAPLSDEARVIIQERVNETYESFTADVAAGRRVSADAVREEGSRFGEGRMLSARQALTAGMVDRIATLEQVVADLGGERETASSVQAVQAGEWHRTALALDSRATNPTARSFTDEADALHDSARALVDRLTSLAEVRNEARLTRAKRVPLAACSEALREAAATIDEVLAATDPDKDRRAIERELVRFEHARSGL